MRFIMGCQRWCAQFFAVQMAHVMHWYTRRSHADATEWPWWLPVLVWPRRITLGMVALAYAVLTVVWTWPMLPDLRQGVITPAFGVNQPDIAQNIWNIWHFVNTWHTGEFLLTQAIFYPQQINLLRQSYGLMQLIVSAPIAYMLGPIAGANSILALGYWGGALGMFVLIYAITRRPYVAFLVGWIFAITPAHQMNVAWAADENAAIQWIMLLHLSLVWWLRQPNWRRGVLVFVALMINTLASGYLGLFGSVYAGLFVIYALLSRWVPAWHRQVVIHGVVIFAAWAIGAAVLLVPIHTKVPYQTDTFRSVTGANSELNFGMRDWYERQSSPALVVSLFDVVVPTSYQRWWSWFFPDTHLVGSQMGGYLGVLIVVLVLWAVWRDAAVRPMAGLAGVLLLCAAGLAVRLVPDTNAPALPGVFWILDGLLLFRNATRPGLFMLWVWIPLLLIVAFRVQRLHPLLVGAVLLGVWLDFAPMAWVISPQTASASATVIGNDPDDGSVLTLPFGKNDARPLRDQMCHGRPIAAGYLARMPLFVTSMRQIIVPANPDEDVIPVLPMDELANLGVRFVVLKSAAATDSRQMLQAGGATLVWHDASEAVWKVPVATRPALVPGAGWNAPEQDVASQWRWKKWRWSSAQSEVLLISRHDGVARVAVSMGGLTHKTMQVYINGRATFTLDVPPLPATNDRLLTIPIQAGLTQLVFATTPTQDSGRVIGALFARLELVQSTTVANAYTVPAVPQYAQRWLCR